jgi:hypothetical protein
MPPPDEPPLICWLEQAAAPAKSAMSTSFKSSGRFM